ncbi:hypothetical protein BV22DRAFT_1118028 [Leucogyrophana mollusca]|uniref:Uncharacterized protein n=1 Tax=Leucogyrophana mollusca TaxID=85980 RepID=A0ACB8BRM5_9AGAM|nr:hypothetical protein BV22DRAFT_1118028 [Leucogyrophana mollusca]
MESTPPLYTPSPPSPSYSTELLPGEVTVVESRRTSSQPRTGVFRRITDNVTLALRDQLPGNVQPSYGRNGLMRGQLTLRGSEDLVSVSLKLEGQLSVQIAGSSRTTVLFSNSYTMWEGSPSGPPCPHSIPFALFFPPTFRDGGQMRDLPPSFETPGNTAICSYTLSVILSRQRKLLSLLKPSDNVTVAVRYHPRSRPQTPMLPSDLPFMSTVKSSPEEWHQVVCAMNSVQSSSLAPIQCLLFIPAIQVYALTDTIPFHLQLRAPRPSMISFLGQPQYSKTPSGSAGTGAGTAIRVYLLRQTTIKLYESTTTTSRVLGEGKLRASQTKSPCCGEPAKDGLDALDWEGEIRCSEDVTIASFATSQAIVKDFIVLALTPTCPQVSSLAPLKHYHPVRLVTDPWTDQTPP